MTTTYFQHQFASVEQYLHHRAPYLMVDRILSCDPTQVVTEKRVRGDEFFLAGHFPGAPIFPGAMQQEVTTQSAGILIAAHYNPMAQFDTTDPFANEYALGVLVRVDRARYKSFARPGDVLVAQVKLTDMVDNLFDFQASISVDSTPIMRIAFQLTNIPSRILQGVG
ncbi:MAG: hypothetical protein U0939_19400 [Pirellulales bacterium]